MSIASALTALQTDITNARTAITTKGGTVTSDGGSSQLATDIASIPSGISLPGKIVTITGNCEIDVSDIGDNGYGVRIDTPMYSNYSQYFAWCVKDGSPSACLTQQQIGAPGSTTGIYGGYFRYDNENQKLIVNNGSSSEWWHCTYGTWMLMPRPS